MKLFKKENEEFPKKIESRDKEEIQSLKSAKYDSGNESERDSCYRVRSNLEG